MNAHVILGLCLLAMQVILAVVLLCEIYRTRSAGGVAVLGELAWVIAGAGWVWYGLLSSHAVVAVSGVVAAVSSAVVCLLVRGDVSSRLWRQYNLVVCVFALSMIVIGVIFGVTGLSVFLAVFGVVQFMPQLSLSAAQLLRGTCVAGVPVRGAVFRSVYTGLWAVYAVMRNVFAGGAIDWPLAVWGVVGCAAFMMQAIVGMRSNMLLKRDMV
jgi:hypothetical protein